MRSFVRAVLVFCIFATSFHDSQAENFCLRPEVGVREVSFRGSVAMISTAREEVNATSFEDVKLASEKAEVSAKVGLSNYRRISTFQGLRKIFECRVGKYVYVGVVNNAASENSARGMNELMTNSITSKPTPK